tara:strand:- start:12000 stop:13196 length:1197 start_codon:yes stop_codon:yes gene_type:complete
MGTEYLDIIRVLFRSEGYPMRRSALHDLLLQVERHGNLFGLEPVIPFFGPTSGNTFVEGIGMLARHLLATYDVPFLMDAACFHHNATQARQQQGWFRHIGDGQNIRTADTPVRLTKMMAHCFSHAPDGLPIERALRWGQVVGQGGSESLARAVMSSRLGATFEHEDFWETVITFSVNNPMIDPSLVDPIIDFIHNTKYIPREIVLPGGQTRRVGPRQPNFSVKGRSVEKLLEQMEEWHDDVGLEIAAEEDLGQGRKDPVVWDRSWIRPLRIQEEVPQTGEVLTWNVQELTSSRELITEGRQMKHCAAPYAKNCRSGKASIWSLNVIDENKERHSVMTVAVDVKGKAVTQVRGRFNIAPVGKARSAKQQTLNAAYLRLLKRSKRILKRWMTQEGLKLRC